MNLLTDRIDRVYFHYLFPSLGSALVITIYSLVDTIAVGQYEGPNGAAAIAVLGPVWAMMISFGLLFGIGGAALMSMRKGAGEEREGNRFFSIGLVSGGGFALILWLFFAVCAEPLLVLFGADETILPLAMRYVFWVRLALPVFTMATILAAYIRNDGAPGLCMVAVLCGGGFNVFGDWFFTFVLDMGISGAGFATVAGQALQMAILCSHFFSKRCGLRWERPTAFFRGLKDIFLLGLPPFLIDFTNGLLICIFNVQIKRYFDTNDCLSVYGVVCTLAALVQALYNGVGQTIQPIVSSNMGAGNPERIRKTLRLAIQTAITLGLAVTICASLFPEALIRIFMAATEGVLSVGPHIFRVYFLAAVPMGLNILFGYYFQATMHTNKGMLISLLRGFFLSGGLLLLLPGLLGGDAIWWTMPVTEALTLCLVAGFAIRVLKKG